MYSFYVTEKTAKVLSQIYENIQVSQFLKVICYFSTNKKHFLNEDI